MSTKRTKNRKHQRKVKINAYKRKFKQAQKLAKQGVEYAQKFIDALAPHLKRNGELKKRDIRSNRQRSAINSIIHQYDADVIQADVEQKQAQGLVNAGYAWNTDEAKHLISAFAVLSANEMMDKLGFSCEQIITAVQEYEEISADNLKKVAEWLIREREERTPSYLHEYLKEDDNYMLFDLMLDILNQENITPEDIEDAFAQEPTTAMRKKIETGEFDLYKFVSKRGM